MICIDSLGTCFLARSLNIQNQQKYRWNKDKQNASNKA
ncbi:hypothetical protein S7335_1953 [Synechococcus sp. PCC 7335]|nr:hypothetical protein S7335_1953 [Synechococcus sp. PCC 7335]